jgi:hypothetical protein
MIAVRRPPSDGGSDHDLDLYPTRKGERERESHDAESGIKGQNTVAVTDTVVIVVTDIIIGRVIDMLHYSQIITGLWAPWGLWGTRSV